MTDDLIERMKEALEGVTDGPWYVQHKAGTDHLFMGNTSQMANETYYPWVPENLRDWELFATPALTLLPEAIKEIEELRGKLAEMQSGQPYTYYGRDGKPVLARDLEDRAEAAEAKLAVAVEASYREGFRDGGWVFGSDHEDKSWIDSNASAALAEIKGEKP